MTTGALHVLGGGRLGELELAERAHAKRPPLRVALVAAAVDAHWLRPGGYHGQALSQVENLLLVNNQLDPAMRFYPMSPVGRQRRRWATPACRVATAWATLAGRIHSIDMTKTVGRHHDLGEYLSASSILGRESGRLSTCRRRRPSRRSQRSPGATRQSRDSRSGRRGCPAHRGLAWYF